MNRPLFVGSYLQSHGGLSANEKEEKFASNDNINDLGIETVSCCLLQWIARMDMDRKLTKVLTPCLHKSLKKLLWLVFPGEICSISSSS